MTTQTVLLALSDHYIKISLETVKLNLEGAGMSEEMPLRLTIAEKLIGLILIIIGVIVTYYSLYPPAGDISHFSSIFVAVGLVVVASGLFLFIVKSE